MPNEPIDVRPGSGVALPLRDLIQEIVAQAIAEERKRCGDVLRRVAAEYREALGHTRNDPMEAVLLCLAGEMSPGAAEVNIMRMCIVCHNEWPHEAKAQHTETCP